ncbi:MAG TPA: hypothetical protein VFG68_14315 [Fimbriiglobus sp.]|nr:hypothetical protein [Fimbriiglobus sp.]
MMVPPPAEVAAKVIARDARRVKWLTWLTVLLWLAAVAGVVYLLVIFKMFLVPRLNAMDEVSYKIAHQQARKESPNPEDVRKLQNWTTTLGIVATVGAAGLAATVGVLALACLGTVLLVFATRRATLRQIQVSLADISAQLGEMRQRTADPASGGRQPPVSGSSIGG